jgi:hypothetical protein
MASEEYDIVVEAKKKVNEPYNKSYEAAHPARTGQCLEA